MKNNHLHIALFLLLGVAMMLPMNGLGQGKRNFSADSVERYRENPAYDYGLQPGPKRPEKKQAQGPTEPQNQLNIGRIGQVVMYAIIFVAFGLIAFLLIRQYGSWGKSQTSISSPIPLQDTTLEDIRATNFAQKALEAEKNGDLRLAIRWNFLRILQKLDERKLIQWRKDKTNLDYFFEIKNQGKKRQFDQIARIFDHVWYGDFSVDQGSYVNIRSQYQQFLNAIK